MCFEIWENTWNLLDCFSSLNVILGKCEGHSIAFVETSWGMDLEGNEYPYNEHTVVYEF